MKSRIKIIIGVIILLVIVSISGGIFYFVKSDKNKAEEVIVNYSELLNNKKYEQMYNMITTDSQSKISKEDFINRNKNIYEGMESLDIKVGEIVIEKNNDNKKASYKTNMMIMGQDYSFDNSATLVKEDGNYKIKWSSNLILPNLNDDDKVSVSTVKSERGKILDRNRITLAEDGVLAQVGIVPGKLLDKDESIKSISEILGISEDDISNKLNASYVKDDMFIPIKTISNSDERKSKLLEIKGIMINDKKGRVYPFGKEAGHLTGYVQAITAELLEKHKNEGYSNNSVIGMAGAESIYEDELRGIDGFKIVILDSLGKVKEEVISNEAKNGNDVILTIDSNIQKNLYVQFEDDKSASVAINPNTGETLALVSTPTYDPNDFVLGMTTEKWNSLNEDANKPLFNRIKATFAPGSVFKPITAAIGVDTKKIDPNEDKNILGLEWQKDSSWGEYTVTRVSEYPGGSNLLNALVYSDNIYFAKAALDIGKDTFEEKLKLFGFDEDSKLEYGVYVSELGKDGSIGSEVSLADSGYGQGSILVSPLHLAEMYTMFINEGSIVKPYLKYKDDKANEYYKENAISKETADIILKDMIQVVENPAGTGHDAMISGVTVAGKTGTAEIKASKDDISGTEIGWFVGMTTNKDNNILVVSMAEDVKEHGGSHYVVPKVKSVIESSN